MHDPQTWTTVWWWPEGRGLRGQVEVGKGGDMQISVIVSTIKIKLRKRNHSLVSLIFLCFRFPISFISALIFIYFSSVCSMLNNSF